MSLCVKFVCIINYLNQKYSARFMRQKFLINMRIHYVYTCVYTNFFQVIYVFFPTKIYNHNDAVSYMIFNVFKSIKCYNEKWKRKLLKVIVVTSLYLKKKITTVKSTHDPLIETPRRLVNNKQHQSRENIIFFL